MKEKWEFEETDAGLQKVYREFSISSQAKWRTRLYFLKTKYQ